MTSSIGCASNSPTRLPTPHDAALRSFIGHWCLVIHSGAARRVNGTSRSNNGCEVYGHLAKQHRYLREQLHRGVGRKLSDGSAQASSPEPLASEKRPAVELSPSEC